MGKTMNKQLIGMHNGDGYETVNLVLSKSLELSLSVVKSSISLLGRLRWILWPWKSKNYQVWRYRRRYATDTTLRGPHSHNGKLLTCYDYNIKLSPKPMASTTSQQRAFIIFTSNFWAEASSSYTKVFLFQVAHTQREFGIHIHYKLEFMQKMGR